MARTMKKFSAGGAQGRYDRRMADIEKDYVKAMTRKTGKAAEVAEAKRQQRIADAKDDLAKRTGADRSATSAAERAAERNLTMTRKYGAPKAVTKDTAGPTGKITDTLGAITAPKSGLATPAKKVEVKKVADKPKPSAADTARNKFFQDSLKKADFKKTARLAETPIAPTKFDAKAFADLKAKIPKPTTNTGGTLLRGKPGGTPLIRYGKDITNDPARAVKLATLKKAAEAPGATQYAKDRYKDAASSDMYAKGGAVKKEKTMKYRSGGSTPPKPTAADRAADTKFRKSVKDLKVTPENAAAIGRGNRSTGMAKGGKATKFGKALVKKSADTKGRAMKKFNIGGPAPLPASMPSKSAGQAIGRGNNRPAPAQVAPPRLGTGPIRMPSPGMKKGGKVKKAGGGKCYAKGGSIDGIAVKGKTKAKRVTMKKGGSC